MREPDGTRLSPEAPECSRHMKRSRPILFSGSMVRAILDGSKTQTRRTVGSKKLSDCADAMAAKQIAAPTSIDLAPGTPFWRWLERGGVSAGFTSPYGKPGDLLWVRETWGYRGAMYAYGRGAKLDEKEVYISYRADDTRRTFIRERDNESGLPKPICRCKGGEDLPENFLKHSDEITRYWSSWKPSIFMPRWVSRITLEVTDVRIQRLTDISEEDARAEGVSTSDIPALINGKRGTVYTFGPDAHRKSFAMLWEAINGKRAPWSTNPFCWVVSFKRIEAKGGQ